MNSQIRIVEMVDLVLLDHKMPVFVLPLPVVIFCLVGTLISLSIGLLTAYVFLKAILKGILEGHIEKRHNKQLKNIE